MFDVVEEPAFSRGQLALLSLKPTLSLLLLQLVIEFGYDVLRLF